MWTWVVGGLLLLGAAVVSYVRWGFGPALIPIPFMALAFLRVFVLARGSEQESQVRRTT